MKSTVSRHADLQRGGDSDLRRSQFIDTIRNANFERIAKFVMPITFGFWALLVLSIGYNFKYISIDMGRPFSLLLIWIVSLFVVFSLFNYLLVDRLIKILKMKTNEIERQKTNLEEQVLEKTTELIRTERLSAIGELSARIAHDIRNPLSIIKNSVEIMKIQNDLDEKTRTNFQRIEKALERIAHQVNDVLDYVRDAPLKLETCFISDIINTAISTLTFPDRIKLRVFPCDIPIQCDSTKIEAVLRNLLLNAIQAIRDDGKISIRVIEKRGIVIIEIENSGNGIPENVFPKIFDPLFTTKQQGTGLGLPICKAIIEKHCGKINVITTENHGSIFVIELPKIKISEILSQRVFFAANTTKDENNKSQAHL